MKTLTLQIASVPDRDDAVSEIWFGNDQVAEVFNDNGKAIRVEIFPAPNGQTWCFDLDAFHGILSEAKSNLQKTSIR